MVKEETHNCDSATQSTATITAKIESACFDLVFETTPLGSTIWNQTKLLKDPLSSESIERTLL